MPPLRRWSAVTYGEPLASSSRMMTRLALLALLLVSSSVRAASSASPIVPPANSSTAGAAADAPFAVFGYLPEYRQARFAYRDFFEAGLTHLIFFSAEVDPATLQLTNVEDRLPAPAEWARIRQLANQYGVKLLLCVGGAGRSAGFPKLVSDVVGRRHFVRELNNILLSRQLDGVDFNWEYPSSMTEWLSLAQLLLEVRSTLGYQAESGIRFPVGSHRHRSKVRSVVLSMALHPHPHLLSTLQVSRILPQLDYLHWMAYDHIVPEEGHSSLAYARSVLADDVIGDLDDAAFRARRQRRRARPSSGTGKERLPGDVDHRRKLTLGIPFYGRHRTDGRLPAETYDHLLQFIRQWAGKRHPEWALDGPELRALNEYAGYDYNGYDLVQQKMQLAKDKGIGGVMIWELGQDVPPSQSPLSLMTAVDGQLARWRSSSAPASAEKGIAVGGESKGDAIDDYNRTSTVEMPESGDDADL